MRFYMIQDKATGKWYKKGMEGGSWGNQEGASVWTTTNGPVGAMAWIERYNNRVAASRLTCATWKPVVPEMVVLDTEKPNVAIVEADDWAGLYLDGKLIEQGHDIRIDDLLRHLGIKAEILWANDEWLNKLGGLPTNLEEVQQ